jgi:hypothetical protein
MLRVFLCVCILLLTRNVGRAEEPFHFPEAKHGPWELKYREGLPVLTVSGKPEEIGEQIGVLAIKPIAPRFKEVVKKHAEALGTRWPILVKICEGLFKRYPEDYQTEIESMAKAGGIERELLVIANAIGDVQHLGGCSAFVVEPDRSSTGGPLFGRNWDRSPLADLDKYGLVIVRHIKGKRAYASVSFPGMLMCGSEMNEAGLALGANDVTETKDGSPAFNPLGMPLTVGGRRLMEECATIADAEKLVKGQKATTTGSIMLCDRKNGAVFEVTAKNILIRRAEDGLCACTNHFRIKELAVQRDCPRYIALEKYRDHKKLGLDDVIEAMRAVHQGRMTLQMVVFEPTELRTHVALGPTAQAKGPLKSLELRSLFKRLDEGK